MKEFKYKLSLATKITPLIQEDTDKYLSLASKSKLKDFLPSNIDLDKKIDFLGFSGEFCTVNRLNSNADAIMTKEALEVCKLLPISFLDVEHSRKSIIGVITNAYYNSFENNGERLSEEDIKDSNKPFNISVAGIIWKLINPDLAEYIEASGDPSSENFGKIFLSWELLFDKYNLIKIDANKYNLEDGELITDQAEVEKLSKYLKSEGGTGYSEDGKKIGRIPIDEIIPAGAGITENPAGSVRAISFFGSNLQIQEKDSKSNKQENKSEQEETVASIDENLKNKEILSNDEKNRVNTEDNIEIKIMKLNSIKDITDENIKECKASDIGSLLETEIKNISDKWETEKQAKEQAIAQANKDIADIKASYEESQKQYTELKANFDKMVQEQEEKAKAEAFSNRMNVLDDKFDLTDEEKQLLAADIKSIDKDEDFDKFLAKTEILLAAKKKGNKKACDESKKEEMKEAKASAETATSTDAAATTTTDKSVETSNAVQTAIENGTKSNETVANTTDAAPSLVDRYKANFGLENWSIQNKRKNRI